MLELASKYPRYAAGFRGFSNECVMGCGLPSSI
jgi:hypothetical protein